MANYDLQVIGLHEFERALIKAPKVITNESKKFIQRAIAKYKSGIINNPWRKGMSGGGAPVLTGNLRDTHLTLFTNFEGRIFPTASYAKYVHEKRPWLDYVYNLKKPDISRLESDLADVIVKTLAE